MNFTTALRTAASNYDRGNTTADYSNAAANTPAGPAAADPLLHPATDGTLWGEAMNALLFLTADLGPSINA
jgi:hypothetical protein